MSRQLPRRWPCDKPATGCRNPPYTAALPLPHPAPARQAKAVLSNAAFKCNKRLGSSLQRLILSRSIASQFRSVEVEAPGLNVPGAHKCLTGCYRVRMAFYRLALSGTQGNFTAPSLLSFLSSTDDTQKETGYAHGMKYLLHT